MNGRHILATAAVAVIAVSLLASATGGVVQQSLPQQEGTNSDLSNTIRVNSTGDERVFYEFTVSGAIEYGEDANLAGDESNPTNPDRITGTSASGSVKGGSDNYRFSGEITAFDLTGGAAEIRVNGERVDVSELTPEPTTTVPTTTVPTTTSPPTTIPTTTVPTTTVPTTTAPPTTPLSTTMEPTTMVPTTTVAPSFTVRNLSADDETVEVNESVEFTATIENAGPTQRTATVELVTFGEVVGSQELTVASGAVQDVSFNHTYEAPGTYTASVGDHSIQIQVESGAGDDNGSSNNSGNGDGSVIDGAVAAVVEATDGLVIVVAVAAVIAIGIIALMRL